MRLDNNTVTYNVYYDLSSENVISDFDGTEVLTYNISPALSRANCSMGTVFMKQNDNHFVVTTALLNPADAKGLRRQERNRIGLSIARGRFESDYYHPMTLLKVDDTYLLLSVEQWEDYYLNEDGSSTDNERLVFDSLREAILWNIAQLRTQGASATEGAVCNVFV